MTQKSAMDVELAAVKAAPAKISDAELLAMIDAASAAPQIAPGLLAWLEGYADWELNRRNGLDYDLLPPEAAIDPSEDEVSIKAAMVIRAAFAQDSRAVLALFDALVDLLTGGGRKQ